jgi:hypothetical protein
MKTMTGKMKQHLETNAECHFEKAPDGFSHVCYITQGKEWELVADAHTLGECVWQAAEKLGEKK